MGTIYECVFNGGDISSLLSSLNNKSEADLLPFLPYLTSLSSCSDNDEAETMQFNLLRRYPQVNTVLEYSSLDYSSIIGEVEQEISTTRNNNNNNNNNNLNNHETLSVHSFEKGHATDRIKVVLMELALLKEGAIERSILLGNNVYLPELCLIIPLIRTKTTYFSLEEIVKGLLNVPLAVPLISSIVMNDCGSFEPIVDILLDSFSSIESTTNTVSGLLSSMCALSKYHSHYIRKLLVKRHSLPELILTITSNFIQDEIAFFSGFVHSGDFLWMRDFFQSSQDASSSPLGVLRESLSNKLSSSTNNENDMVDDNSHSEEPTGNNSLLHLYCAMIGLLGLHVNSSEADHILNTITLNNLSPSKFFSPKLGLSFLLVCENLLKLVPRSKVIEVVKSFMAEKEAGRNQGKEMLLMVTVYFHTGQHSSVVDLVRSELGFQASIHSDSLHSFSDLLKLEIPDSILVSELGNLIKGKLVSNADSKETSDIVLNCVYHLMKGGVIDKLMGLLHINIADWIAGLLLEIEEPIHPLLPALIDEYVDGILDTSRSNLNKISDIELKKIFNKEGSLAPKVKALYYILRFNEMVSKKNRSSSVSTTQVVEYSQSFLHTLSIKPILTYVQTNTENYAFILPPLLSLSVTQLPHLFDVVCLLDMEDLNEDEKLDGVDNQILNENNDVLDPKSLNEIFGSTLSTAVQTSVTLHQLSPLSPSSLYTYINPLIDTLLPLIVFPSPSLYTITLQFVQLWHTLYIYNPMELGLKTFNVISSPNILTPFENTVINPPLISRIYTHNDLINDPLLVLRCHPYIFSNPPLLQILFYILTSYMAASKKHLLEIPSNQTGAANIATKSEDANLLILTQESAIIQLLLELCLPNPLFKVVPSASTQSELEEDKGVEEERCTLITTYIHQLFIENPLLIKLVHFQGYSPKLLEITVAIPSMHICLEFLPELINQPIVDRVIFGIQLAGFVIEKYPIPKSLNIARIVISRISSSILSSNSASTPISFTPHFTPFSFLKQTLPSLIKICKAFSFLTEDVVGLLLELQRSYSTLLTRKKEGSLNYLVTDTLSSLIGNVLVKENVS